MNRLSLSKITAAPLTWSNVVEMRNSVYAYDNTIATGDGIDEASL